ncbi:MAG: site-2 protease family protein [Candidatus Omnitrophica bacterium]|nr:site-2 protease family protein [Candidatus Omnitrophota bacterium]
MSSDIDIISFLIAIVAFGIALTIHEYSHGRVAYALGDTTAKDAGRLTLNPLAHIDPVGTVIVPLLLAFLPPHQPFGWAKPVPVNFYNLRNPHRDMIWVGLAGPASNFIMAILISLPLRFNWLSGSGLFGLFLLTLALINLILGVFNLIPIPPLDGSRVLTGLLPLEYARAYSRLEPFGFIILLAMLWFGLIGNVLGVLVRFSSGLLGLNWLLF